ncbi:4-hydroxy-tetrahydrodipicolinate reductase [Bhargavaea beijingensis]|uniref:4-hydroxy-tetrahydrodipicolinate reductase n=1 Tax=Bhargavaea beijingensis TaxID=426756 RepID=A0ABX9ZA59_9BACL|nr:4-hydroxy-tetrahydrodipicolinate reductase [Bhargavaea beijingensis]MCW1928169.1 4-hydroxy-tetrahydrodipicolinate reductase [Bhargavaea beijingensis]RSK24847.1 4-hydroxy-tetrahydrodipicolinate reductase [Bhargavaea beijingensis]
MTMIRVAVAGPRGRMGALAVEAMITGREFLLVGVLDRKMAERANTLGGSVPIYTDMFTLADEAKPDVLVELTNHESVYPNTRDAILHGIRPVVGTSGLTEEQIGKLGILSRKHGVGCILAPNFSIGAALLMKFASMAVSYMPDAEIIELHHDGKKDYPSGTAALTARMMEEASGDSGAREKGAGRGTDVSGIPIHSVRLPGLLSHQEVLFGGEGQLLTLRHDSFSRQSYVSGMVLAVKEVMNRDCLINGLDKIIG